MAENISESEYQTQLSDFKVNVLSGYYIDHENGEDLLDIDMEALCDVKVIRSECKSESIKFEKIKEKDNE